MLGREAVGELVGAEPRRDRERAHMVDEARLGGRHEVGEGAVRPRVGVVDLLAQHREAHAVLEHEVVALGDAAGQKP